MSRLRAAPVDRWRATLSGSLGDERGQTLTEYLMISGLMLAVAVAWIQVMFPTTQDILRKVAECVMSDVCDGGSLFGF